MEIKTIKERLDSAVVFDARINEALTNGFQLRKRYIIEGKRFSENTYSHTMLVAELIKNPDATTPIRRPLEFEVSLDMSKAKEQIAEFVNDPEEIKIKYFVEDLEPIREIAVGDWIDLRAAEDVTLEVGEYKLIRLGVGMILPDGYEALVVPRSSTFKHFGIIQANSVGVIDNSYSGDADEWHFPAIALRDCEIHKGDRICQFRIVRNQPNITLARVEFLNEVSRGGIGSTGKR